MWTCDICLKDGLKEIRHRQDDTQNTWYCKDCHQSVSNKIMEIKSEKIRQSERKLLETKNG
jgi:hypothetical protein